MRIAFIKGHGSGNDFPAIDAREMTLDDSEWAALARALADRDGTVGGDGLLAMTAGDKTHAFGFRMWNSDGSEAETCLNGLRLIARMGFAAFGVDRATVHLRTSIAEVARDEEIAPGVYGVRETAGPASLDVTEWPLIGDANEIVDQPIDRLPTALAFTSVAMPNPHLIAFVDAIDDVDLIRIGSVCEAAPDWLPNRANVSFVVARDAATLFVRTFERGVGLTDSCGSAMAASAFAAALTGRIDFGAEVTVLNKGGLVRAQAESDGMVTLTGNATFEWAGSVEVDLATATAGPVTVMQRFDEEIAAWDRVLAGCDLRHRR